MKKKILIVLDTNVYGWYVDYTEKGIRKPEAINSFKFLSKVLEKKESVELFATETIEKEIKSAKSPTLANLFYSVLKGVIKNTERVKKLSKKYLEEEKKAGLAFVTIEDCEIVAASAIAGVKLLITENRKSLNVLKVKEVFDKINVKQNLSSVEIKNCREAMEYVFS